MNTYEELRDRVNTASPKDSGSELYLDIVEAWVQGEISIGQKDSLVKGMYLRGFGYYD